MQTAHTAPLPPCVQVQRPAASSQHCPAPHTIPRQLTCALLVLRLAGVEGHDLHSDGVSGDGAAQPWRPHFMGLHVLLHVGLLGKGSATHDALEGLLPCVTAGEGTRSAEEERGGSPRQGPRGVAAKGQCWALSLADHTWSHHTRALRSDSPEVDCERPGETRLVHRQNICGLGMTGDQRKEQERKTATSRRSLSGSLHRPWASSLSLGYKPFLPCHASLSCTHLL